MIGWVVSIPLGVILGGSMPANAPSWCEEVAAVAIEAEIEGILTEDEVISLVEGCYESK